MYLFSNKMSLLKCQSMRTSVFKLIARSKCDYSGVTKTTLTKTNIDTNIIDPSRREKSGKIRRGRGGGTEGGREGGVEGWREGGVDGWIEERREGWERGRKGEKESLTLLKHFIYF